MKIRMKKVYNVGVNDYVGLVTSNGVKIRSYSTWKKPYNKRCKCERDTVDSDETV